MNSLAEKKKQATSQKEVRPRLKKSKELDCPQKDKHHEAEKKLRLFGVKLCWISSDGHFSLLSQKKPHRS